MVSNVRDHALGFLPLRQEDGPLIGHLLPLLRKLVELASDFQIMRLMRPQLAIPRPGAIFFYLGSHARDPLMRGISGSAAQARASAFLATRQS